jgi:hypothetical protein
LPEAKGRGNPRPLSYGGILKNKNILLTNNNFADILNIEGVIAMKKNHVSLTLCVTYIAVGMVILVAAGLPWILEQNSIVRTLLSGERTAILAGYYCCLPFLLLTLWKVRRLLANIQKEEVFTEENVKLLATIRNCCAGIFLVCLIAGLFFFPLLLLVAILGFLCLMMQVLKQVMAQAVAIREENDLTV